ncbi:hypothetical protein JB92DRAFT_2838810 [Gautieria morchelliformis]|nr:hypothetical protein JB92DRAFT_2838810 [Gautieria morchelliformis]
MRIARPAMVITNRAAHRSWEIRRRRPMIIGELLNWPNFCVNPTESGRDSAHTRHRDSFSASVISAALIDHVDHVDHGTLKFAIYSMMYRLQLPKNAQKSHWQTLHSQCDNVPCPNHIPAYDVSRARDVRRRVVDGPAGRRVVGGAEDGRAGGRSGAWWRMPDWRVGGRWREEGGEQRVAGGRRKEEVHYIIHSTCDLQFNYRALFGSERKEREELQEKTVEAREELQSGRRVDVREESKREKSCEAREESKKEKGGSKRRVEAREELKQEKSCEAREESKQEKSRSQRRVAKREKSRSKRRVAKREKSEEREGSKQEKSRSKRRVAKREKSEEREGSKQEKSRSKRRVAKREKIRSKRRGEAREESKREKSWKREKSRSKRRVEAREESKQEKGRRKRRVEAREGWRSEKRCEARELRRQRRAGYGDRRTKAPPDTKSEHSMHPSSARYSHYHATVLSLRLRESGGQCRCLARTGHTLSVPPGTGVRLLEAWARLGSARAFKPGSRPSRQNTTGCCSMLSNNLKKGLAHCMCRAFLQVVYTVVPAFVRSYLLTSGRPAPQRLPPQGRYDEDSRRQATRVAVLNG